MNAGKKELLVLTICGIVPVVWLALLVAPAIDGSIMNSLPELRLERFMRTIIPSSAS